MSHIVLINRPNVKVPGSRESAVYGAPTRADIEARSRQVGEELALRYDSYFSDIAAIACSVSGPAGTNWLSWRRTGTSR